MSDEGIEDDWGASDGVDDAGGGDGGGDGAGDGDGDGDGEGDGDGKGGLGEGVGFGVGSGSVTDTVWSTIEERPTPGLEASELSAMAICGMVMRKKHATKAKTTVVSRAIVYRKGINWIQSERLVLF